MEWPEIDLFASRISHQVKNYFSWKADPDCLAVDAFRQDWSIQFPYAFPPFCLITRVLRQMDAQDVQKMILITPLWPSQPWYPLAMSMSIQNPILLPSFPDLLQSPSKSIHPLLQDCSLKLVAWLVSGTGWRSQEYRDRLQRSSCHLAGRAQHRLTSQPGRGGVCGVIDGVWIPLDVL